MAHLEDGARTGLDGESGGKLFAFRLVVGEADFDQAVVGQGLIEGGEQGWGHAVVSDMDDGFDFLGARFEFAQRWSGDAHAKNGLLAFSCATVVSGPWPGQMMVSSDRLRISRRMLSRVAV